VSSNGVLTTNVQGAEYDGVLTKRRSLGGEEKGFDHRANRIFV
jgi:hypothetical protein